MEINDATTTVAQAKVMFDASGVAEDEIEKLAGEFCRIFESRHPGVSGVAKALIQRSGSRRWEVLGKIETGAEQVDFDGLEVFMAKGSSGGSGAHEGKGSSDGKGKGGYLGKHEAPVKPVPAKGGGKK